MYMGHKVHKLVPAVWGISGDVVAPLDVHTALISLKKKSHFKHVASTAVCQ